MYKRRDKQYLLWQNWMSLGVLEKLSLHFVLPSTYLTLVLSTRVLFPVVLNNVFELAMVHQSQAEIE